METREIVHRMRNDLYCCYRHFVHGRSKNQQTHCYGHVVKGLILPEGVVAAEFKRKTSQRNLLKTAKQDDNRQMQIVGKGINLRQFGSDVHVDGAKGSLPQHLRSPFVYCDKVYKRGARPTTSSTDRQQFLVAAETSCRRHLKYDLEIEQQLKGLNKEQRREFFSRVFNLTESLYNFYGEVHKCLEEKQHQQQNMSTTSNPTLSNIFEEFCRKQGIDLSKRHELQMVDESEFKSFIRDLGFPVEQRRLIDEFWELVFREGVFQNYQIVGTNASGKSSRRTSKVISMKAFIYNYRKFFANREAYVFVFSPNMLRQRMTDLRFAMHPWKKQYRMLAHRLKDLSPIQFSICDKLQKSNKQLSEQLLRIIEQRNSTCFRLRTLAKFYHKVLSKPTVTYDGLHQTFLERLDKQRQSMSLFEDFLQSFRNFRREIASREPAFDQLTVRATDLADFLAYCKVPKENAELVIKWIGKFYKYLNFYKGEEDVHFDLATGKTSLKINIQFSYDELSEFLHFKTAKAEDQQNIANDFLLRLEEFHRQNVEGVDLTRSRDVFEQNVLTEFFLREMRVELVNFEKLLAIVKIGSQHEEEFFSQDTIKEIERFLLKNTASQSFTLKFLFGDQVITQARNCEACNSEPPAEDLLISASKTVNPAWRTKIDHGRRLFSEQLDSLQHVLLDWNTIAKQSAVAAYPNVKCVRTQQVKIEQPTVQKEQEEHRRDFRIKYVEMPKQKIYKVRVTKHEHVSAQEAIFEEQSKPKKEKEPKQRAEEAHDCPVCYKKFPASQLTTSFPTTGYNPCICTDGASYASLGTESELTIRSVSDMQDQLLRLLSL